MRYVLAKIDNGHWFYSTGISWMTEISTAKLYQTIKEVTEAQRHITDESHVLTVHLTVDHEPIK